MQLLSNPFPIWIDRTGGLLDAGYIYVGQPGLDPEIEANRIDLFLDEDLTLPIEQPLRTLSGLIVSGANAVRVYMDEDDYSLRVKDANGQNVSYEPSAAVGEASSFQPLDADLTTIAGQANTAYGLALLLLANQAALQTAVGLPAALALVGGTMTGNITRSGKGVHVYHNDAAMTGGRIFVTAAGAADPTSQAGDIWFEVE